MTHRDMTNIYYYYQVDLSEESDEYAFLTESEKKEFSKQVNFYVFIYHKLMGWVINDETQTGAQCQQF